MKTKKIKKKALLFQFGFAHIFTIYDSGQYNQDISRFRRMALGTDSFDYDSYSSEYNSGEMNASRASWRFQNNSSGESETQAFKGGSVTPQNHPGGRQF